MACEDIAPETVVKDMVRVNAQKMGVSSYRLICVL